MLNKLFQLPWNNTFPCYFARSKKKINKKIKNKSAWIQFTPSPLYHLLWPTHIPKNMKYVMILFLKNIILSIFFTNGTRGKAKMDDLLVLFGLWISGSLYLCSPWEGSGSLHDPQHACYTCSSAIRHIKQNLLIQY